MSRLFAVVCPMGEIAAQFGAEGSVDAEVPSETIEGTKGLVVVERDGRRMLKSITWGMPRLTAEMRRDRAPPERLGLVADLTNPLWNHLVVDPIYRCLIPISHFANPEGEPGKKTRTWFSSADGSLMAWAGFCRNSEEFGPVFAGMTAEANDLIKPYNERMPALVRPDEYGRWLRGSISDVIEIQFRPPPPSEKFEITHTNDRWRSGIPPRANPTASRASMVM